MLSKISENNIFNLCQWFIEYICLHSEMTNLEEIDFIVKDNIRFIKTNTQVQPCERILWWIYISREDLLLLAKLIDRN